MKHIGARLLALILALLMVFSLLTACASDDTSKKDNDDKEKTEDKVDNEDEDEDEDKAEDKDESKDDDKEDESKNENSDSNSDVADDSESDSESEEESENESESASDTESESATESESESESDSAIPDPEGTVTIFANGAYTASFIKSDLATSFDTNVYNQIRGLFKDTTLVNPSMETDFTPKGQEKYDGPAILVGDTNYPETEAVKKTLKDNQAIAKLVGNKFVIVYSSSDAVTKLISTLKTTLKKSASATEIKIDASWDTTAKVSVSYSENVNFKDSGLTQKIDITSLGLGTSYDAGQDCKTYIKTGANKTNYTTICSAIERAGATRYTGNTIGSNLFTTYVTQTQIIHVMFFPVRNEVRTAVDKRGEGTGGFSLPGLSIDNKYTKTTTSEMIVCDISNADWPGGMCVIFKLSDGRFFIIDAGMGGKVADGREWIGSSSGWIYATLKKHASDPKNIKVAGWLITHVHSDHAGGLYDMALGYHGSTKKGKHTVMPKEVTKYIKIENLIYNQPATTKFGRTGWMTTIINAFNVKNVIKAHPGQVFHYADLSLTIYGAQDIMLEKSSESGDLNDFSLVARVMFNGKSALFLGDSDTIPNPRLADIYKETLKSDILQLAHHGYGDTGDASVNSYCNPSIVLWVVSDRDLRSNYKINTNASISTLSGVKHYKPGTGNLVFKSDWTTYRESAETIINMIPACDGTHCGNSNCTQKSSTWNSYNS